ncbi:neurogenic locus notch protein 2 [Trichuris trichiura]|uniref:Neurogenic locus notch protein 2 n=1 Tax=Trichuris trichiura TaxID=36087 RepID=A0A077ZG34_TRITR|nr:neurogenic locus notch protein 2 [Trichuris trichiura]
MNLRVSWSLSVIRSALLLLGCLSAAFPCPFAGPKSYGYVHNGSCFSAVFSGLLPKTDADSDVLQVLDEYCKNLEPSARLANLLEGKQLQMPPPKYWFFHKDRLSFFAGTQANPYQRKESKEGKNQVELNKDTINISSQYVNVHVRKISSENAHTEGSRLLCPIIIAKSNEPKYTIKFANCKSKPLWDIFFCKSASKTINPLNPQVEDTLPARMCEYDKEKGKCFLKLLESKLNTSRRSASKLCRCPSCTVDTWTKWGPWSSTCGLAERYRVRAKDGEIVSHCIDDQSLCCFEMENKNLPECTASDQQIQVITDCLNGGIPIDMGKGNIVCSCKRNFTGTLCEKTKPCDHVKCRNGGHCLGDREKFTCVCPGGYMGTLCETEVRPCVNKHVCLNGGTCQNNGTIDTCLCPTGFSGPHCDIYLLSQDCNAATCVNGDCIVTDGRVACLCKRGFHGMYCATQTNECASMPCLNNGRCENVIGGFQCICPDGYVGQRCEEKASPCARNPCIKGLCSRVGNGYMCSCYPGYEGVNCQTAEIKQQKRTPWDTEYALPLTILVVLLTIGVIGLIFYTYKGHVVALKKESTPQTHHEKSEEIEFSEKSPSRRGTMQKVAEFLAALGWGKTGEESEVKDESDRQDKAKSASERSSRKGQLEQDKQSAKSPKRKGKGLRSPFGKRSPASSSRKGRSKKEDKNSPPSGSLSTPKSKGRSPASDRERKSPSLSSRSRKYIYTAPGYRPKKQLPARPLHLRIIRKPEPRKVLQSEAAEAYKRPNEEDVSKSRESERGSGRNSPMQKQSSLREERKGNESPSEDRDQGSKRWWSFRLKK